MSKTFKDSRNARNITERTARKMRHAREYFKRRLKQVSIMDAQGAEYLKRRLQDTYLTD